MRKNSKKTGEGGLVGYGAVNHSEVQTTVGAWDQGTGTQSCYKAPGDLLVKNWQLNAVINIEWMRSPRQCSKVGRGAAYILCD